MNKTQLKAVLEATDEFAVYILPHPTKKNPVSYLNTQIANVGLHACPVDLVKAKVLGLNEKYEERFTFGCGGDQDHFVERKNAIEIEVELPYVQNYATWDAKFWRTWIKATGHKNLAKVSKRDGKDFLTLKTKPAAILAPWGEYELARAKNVKEDEEAYERRYTKFDTSLDPVRKVFGKHAFANKSFGGDRPDHPYVTREFLLEVTDLILDAHGSGKLKGTNVGKKIESLLNDGAEHEKEIAEYRKRSIADYDRRKKEAEEELKISPLHKDYRFGKRYYYADDKATDEDVARLYFKN